MNGCLGDVSKTGPYVTGECQTIELALKELQIHIDTYHEKDLKKQLKCEFPSCDFETEFLTNKAAMERLKLHASIQHSPKLETPENHLETRGENENNKAVYKATQYNIVYKKNLLKKR